MSTNLFYIVNHHGDNKVHTRDVDGLTCVYFIVLVVVPGKVGVVGFLLIINSPWMPYGL